MIKVLHIGAGNLYGGIESLLYTLAKCRDYCPEMAPEFALHFEGKILEKLQESAAPVHLLSPVRYSRPWTLWTAQRKLKKLLLERQYDVVIGHECWVHGIVAPIVLGMNIPYVFWAHGFHDTKNWLTSRCQKYQPKGVIANSHCTGKTMDGLFKGACIQILYCPIVLSNATKNPNITNIRNQFGASDSDVVILLAGRWEKCKGHESLIEALGELQDDQSWVCWIAGQPQNDLENLYRQKILARARKLGCLHRVKEIGFQNDMDGIYEAADIYCQPNQFPETFGLAFVEAINQCLPVVTSNFGGACEILNEDCGVLVSPDNSLELAKALRKLIADPSERKRLGQNGPKRARELCDPSQQINRLKEILLLAA